MFLRRLFKRDRATRRPPAHTRLGVEPLESRLALYSASANIWPHPELITIGFVPDGTNVGASSNLISKFDSHSNAAFRAGWRDEILKAAQVWAQHANLNFALIADDGAQIGTGDYQQGDPTMADIRLGGYNFGTTTLAQAYMPPPVNNYSVAGDIQFNTNRPWTLGTPQVPNDLFTVAAHEFGHTLGMNHTTVTNQAVMWAAYVTGRANLHSDDINGIKSKYGVRAEDVYDLGALDNDSFLTATVLTPTAELDFLTNNLDLTTVADVDYYLVVAPEGVDGTLTVKVQTAGLSLMSPKLEVYANDQVTLLGEATAAGDRDGATLTVTLADVWAGQAVYLKVSGAETRTGAWRAFNTGRYGLALAYGPGVLPEIPLPDTLTEEGIPNMAGGGIPSAYEPEFRVNTTTASTQETDDDGAQTVAMDANGNYVVVWASDGQDGDDFGVYARRYAADGTALGGEFRVNTTTANDQRYPGVAMNGAGAFVVTWSSYGQDGSGYAIYAQRYDAAGVAQGGEFRVNTTTANDQKNSSVAIDSEGDFVIAWSSMSQDGGGWGVYARRYDAAGVAQSGEFRVNTTTAGDQNYATVAANATGSFVVSWSSTGQDGSGYGVYARRFDAAGVAQTGEVLVNNHTADAQQQSSVAMEGTSDFVVAWSSRYQDGSGWGVYARRYGAAGNALGSEFRVNTTTSGDQRYASVAIDQDSNFLITWSSYGQDGGGWGVYGQHYSAGGVTLGTEFRVNTSTAGDQRYSSVVTSSSGRAIIVWSGAGGGDSSGVFAQQYFVSSGNGLANMEAHGYSEHGCDCDHDHGGDHDYVEERDDNGCGCAACGAATALVGAAAPALPPAVADAGGLVVGGVAAARHWWEGDNGGLLAALLQQSVLTGLAPAGQAPSAPADSRGTFASSDPVFGGALPPAGPSEVVASLRGEDGHGAAAEGLADLDRLFEAEDVFML